MFNYDKINGLIADKQRVNKNTTIANMATGIGIAVDALNKIKKGVKFTPFFIMVIIT